MEAAGTRRVFPAGGPAPRALRHLVQHPEPARAIGNVPPGPYVSDIPGAERFKGRQQHTTDYRTAEEFSGQHVIVVGAGISAFQLLDEVSRVTTTTWVTRSPRRSGTVRLTPRPAAPRSQLWRTRCAAACRQSPSFR